MGWDAKGVMWSLYLIVFIEFKFKYVDTRIIWIVFFFSLTFDWTHTVKGTVNSNKDRNSLVCQEKSLFR